MEWRQGELFPRVGFIVTNMSAGPQGDGALLQGSEYARAYTLASRSQILTETVSATSPQKAKMCRSMMTVVNQQHWDRSGPERIVVMESQR